MSQTDTAVEGETPSTDTPAPTEDQTPTEAPEAEAETKTFDANYVKSLRAEAARYRKEAAAAKAKAEEYEDAQKTELEKAQARAEKESKVAADATAKLTRFEVATEKGITGNLMELLTGDSREELEAKADLILESVKPAEEPTPSFDGGPRETAEEPKDPATAGHNEWLMGVIGGKK